MEEAYKKAWDILTKQRPALDALTKRLLEKEILDRKAIEEIVLGTKKTEKKLSAAAREMLNKDDEADVKKKEQLGLGNIKIATNEAGAS